MPDKPPKFVGAFVPYIKWRRLERLRMERGWTRTRAIIWLLDSNAELNPPRRKARGDQDAA